MGLGPAMFGPYGETKFCRLKRPLLGLWKKEADGSTFGSVLMDHPEMGPVDRISVGCASLQRGHI